MRAPPHCNPVLFHLQMTIDILWVMLYSIPSIFQALYYAIIGRPEKEVNGQIVMVTGSGQGLGRELCLRFARLGCTVICVDLMVEPNEETLMLIREAGGKAIGYTCDVSDRKAIMKLADDVKTVDILINNAGVYPVKGIWNSTEEEMKSVININLMSQFWTVQAFMPRMKARKSGHIVAISSMAGLIGLPYIHAYATSKAAVTALMKSLSLELSIEKNDDIKLTTVHPYFIKTRKDLIECCKARIPPIEVDDAVDAIMRGIRQELESFTVPNETIHLVNMLSTFPKKFSDKFHSTFPCNIEEPKEDVYKIHLRDHLNKNTGSIEKLQ